MFRTAQKYRIQSKIRTMKNNISAPPNEINNVEEKSSHGEKLENIISLEEAGSVDGATPEVVSSEEDNNEGNTQNLNGMYLKDLNHEFHMLSLKLTDH